MANTRTTVILKTDIVDSTPRTARLSQSEMGLQRRQHRRFISDIVSRNDGKIFQEEGDAYWIQLPSVTTAVLAAIDIHQALRAMQAGKGEQQRLSIRAVVTVGDILFQENDTIGMVMNLTARIEKITPPDEIYLSQAAWLVLNKGEIQTSFVGEFELKGFNDSERIYKVEQKHRTRLLARQYIVFTDAKRFTQFLRSAETDQVERFLLECDDLINEICEKYNGIVRQVNGDQYFITFVDCMQVISAINELSGRWKHMIEYYGVGLSIAVHKGSLNVIRSYVYGEDIHATIILSDLTRLIDSRPDEVCVIASGEIRDELKGSTWESHFQMLDKARLKNEKHVLTFQQIGVYRLFLDQSSLEAL